MSQFGGMAFFALLALLLVGGLAGPTLVAALRRERVMRRPFPAPWRQVLRRRMPLYARLPPELQRRLRQRVQVMLAEVPFIGCAGFSVSDEVRVLIAAQAALLLMQRGLAFRGLREVLVYPGHFVVERAREGFGGVVHEARQVLAGESWQRGQVVLAWDAVVEGAADPADGHNVVIHEFAHQLDQENGRANGAPFLAAGGSGALRRLTQQRWAHVLSGEFSRLRTQIARGESGLIDAYAATDAAEFFAVVSELFFERPHELGTVHPELFDEFARCYRLDPRRW
jgi:Mlc titration factor MtfA (ptsG expression regulator)